MNLHTSNPPTAFVRPGGAPGDRAGPRPPGTRTDEQLVRDALARKAKEPGRSGAPLPEGRDGPSPRAGATDPYERLLARHQRPIVNFLYRMIGDFDHAVDLAQDVFTRAFLALDRFDERYRFSTWLYRIASNRAIDHLRRNRPPTVSLDAPPSGRPGSAPGAGPRLELAATDAGPEERLQARETADRLSQAIRALPPEYRQLILLRHVQHLRYDEIAQVTGLPLGTVKNRIFRARNLLRGAIDGPARGTSGKPSGPPVSARPAGAPRREKP